MPRDWRRGRVQFRHRSELRSPERRLVPRVRAPDATSSGAGPVPATGWSPRSGKGARRDKLQVTPDCVEQGIPREHFSLMALHVIEETEFQCSRADFLSTHKDLHGCGVDLVNGHSVLLKFFQNVSSGSQQVDLQFLVPVLACPQVQRYCRQFIDDVNCQPRLR